MDRERIRTFIAIELPAPVKSDVSHLKETLTRARADVKWVRPENIHITLKFLGNIDEGRVTEAIQGTIDSVSESQPFVLSLNQAGGFPNLDRARILWIDIEKGQDHLSRLHDRIEDCLFGLDFPKEARPFTPHLTLGRIRSPNGLNGLTDLVRKTSFQSSEFLVDHVSVLSSVLKPAGAEYTLLQRVDFS